jgi:hypothetical protein
MVWGNSKQQVEQNLDCTSSPRKVKQLILESNAGNVLAANQKLPNLTSTNAKVDLFNLI